MPAPLDLSQSFTGRKMVYLTKLENKYEVEAVRDIASCEVYAHMAEDAIGFEWEDGKQMTPHWASRIWNTYDDLSYKLLKSINACPVTGEDERYGNV